MTVTVTVYSKADCRQCEATKRRLDELDIDYTRRSAVKNAEQLKAMGFLEAPVVIVERYDGSVFLDEDRPSDVEAYSSESWSGFDRDKIDAIAA